jgi:photosystem II reaction center protein PsbM
MSRLSVQILSFFSMLTAAMAFTHSAGRTLLKASAMTMKMDLPKAVASMAPMAVTLPAFASTDVIQSTMPLSLEVTFAAYLAVLLGTFVPVTFLIVLYSQSEARKAGARSAK